MKNIKYIIILSLIVYTFNLNAQSEINTTAVEPNDLYTIANNNFNKNVTLLTKNDIYENNKKNEIIISNQGKENIHKQAINEAEYKIKNLDINTQFQDFGTSYYKNQIVFASTRELTKYSKRIWNWNEMRFLELFVADLENLTLSNIKSLTYCCNRTFHEGPASYTKDGNYTAFTRKNYNEKGKNDIIKMEIFTAEKNGEEWGKEIPVHFNSSKYSVGHPSLTADGNKMYFSSTAPGGFGGVDIYFVEKNEKGDWGMPQNLGNNINTKGNEVFPFIHESGMLFFASSGLDGFGGLDIYFSKSEDGTYSKAQNIGAPINSDKDDFALIIDEEIKSGFFSSNREGGKGDDDIYSFELQKELMFNILVTGKTVNTTGEILANTNIKLSDRDGNIIKLIKSDKDGTFIFEVIPKKVYKLSAIIPEYKPFEKVIDTSLDNKEFIQNMVFEKIATVTTVEVTKKIIEINPIYFEFDKYNISKNSKITLDKLIKLMNEYPKMEIELSSYTDCQGSAIYNLQLSKKRARESERYIKSHISDPTRIKSKGYGETKLIIDCNCDNNNCSEEEHQQNRRTEFKIIKVK